MAKPITYRAVSDVILFRVGLLGMSWPSRLDRLSSITLGVEDWYDLIKSSSPNELCEWGYNAKGCESRWCGFVIKRCNRRRLIRFNYRLDDLEKRMRYSRRCMST